MSRTYRKKHNYQSKNAEHFYKEKWLSRNDHEILWKWSLKYYTEDRVNSMWLKLIRDSYNCSKGNNLKHANKRKSRCKILLELRKFIKDNEHEVLNIKYSLSENRWNWF